MNREKWESLPEEPWKEGPINFDKHYFFDEDDLVSFCEEDGIDEGDDPLDPRRLSLVLCELRPAPLFQIDDLVDAYQEDLPESFQAWDFSAAIKRTVLALSEAIQTDWPKVWFPRDARPTPDSLPQVQSDS